MNPKVILDNSFYVALVLIEDNLKELKEARHSNIRRKECLEELKVTSAVLKELTNTFTSIEF